MPKIALRPEILQEDWRLLAPQASRAEPSCQQTMAQEKSRRPSPPEPLHEVPGREPHALMPTYTWAAGGGGAPPLPQEQILGECPQQGRQGLRQMSLRGTEEADNLGGDGSHRASHPPKDGCPPRPCTCPPRPGPQEPRPGETRNLAQFKVTQKMSKGRGWMRPVPGRTKKTGVSEALSRRPMA